MDTKTCTSPENVAHFALLPSEILYMILFLLPPPSLAAMSATCHRLRKHTQNDNIWMNLVNSNIPRPLSSSAPFNSWRKLYISQYPMWFLVRNKIWFSNQKDTGNLIMTRYNPYRSMIEGFRVVARHSFRQFEQWSKDPTVLIHSFNPEVTLLMDDPVVELFNFIVSPNRHYSKYSLGEINIARHYPEYRMVTNFMLCARIPHEDQEDTQKTVWPPRIIPSDERVDVSEELSSSWEREPERPRTYEDICLSTFKLRRWAQIGHLGIAYQEGASRRGVTTFATLQPELYTPTPEKPYRGVWVGDYSGHGSEFLLVMQRDGPVIDFLDDEHPDTEDKSSISTSSSTAGPSPSSPPRQRLEAVKLTGDTNVPRGEISFLSEDIGAGGLIRVADEDLFKGARVVRAQGHIAWTNFRDDKFIPAQLFLISNDCMALFWEELKHISYYRRVDVDELVYHEFGSHHL
ncbi:hypothetical protein PABG_02795 [Paracoccidioides brasiliensis Pb03]|nr:hypothetical protein PABG_02795 [Paracoccidioides brasiliensis Pb03]